MVTILSRAQCVGFIESVNWAYVSPYFPCIVLETSHGMHQLLDIMESELPLVVEAPRAFPTGEALNALIDLFSWGRFLPDISGDGEDSP